MTRQAVVLLLSVLSGFAGSGCRHVDPSHGTVDSSSVPSAPQLAASTSDGSETPLAELPPLVDTMEELERRLHSDQAFELNIGFDSDVHVSVKYPDGSTCSIKTLDDPGNTVTLTFDGGTEPRVETIRVAPHLLQQWLTPRLTAVLPPGAHMTMSLGGETITIDKLPGN